MRDEMSLRKRRFRIHDRSDNLVAPICCSAAAFIKFVANFEIQIVETVQFGDQFRHHRLLDREQFLVCCLDAKHDIIGVNVVSIG